MAWRSTGLAVRPGRLRAVVALAALLVLAGGCGDDDGGGTPRATATATVGALPPTASATATNVATASAPATAAPSATPPPTLTFTSPPTATPEIPTATATATPTSTPDESVLAKYVERGPYVVGVTTLNIGDRDIEVWYPVDPGSEAGVEKASYASFEVLPEAIQQLLPPDLNIVVEMDAYRDVPASGDGPFPVLTFSHGAGGFRQAYSGLLSSIASHGLVVASLDHLEWGLLAQIGLLPPGINRDPGEIVLAAVDRLAAASAEAGSPLAGGVDATRVATAGHSAGGRAAFALPDQPEVRAMLGFATGASSSGVAGRPILLLVGAEDGGAAGLEQAYEDLSPIKRFVSIGRAAHNSFTDQCAIIHGGNNFLVRLVEAGFPIPQNLLDLAIDGCRPENLAPAEVWKVTQHFTVAHLRAAFGLDDPPVGLGEGVAGAFGAVTVRYRSADDLATPPAGVRGFVVSTFGSVVATHDGDPCPGGFNLNPGEHDPPLADDCADPQANQDPLFNTLAAPGTVDGVDLDGIASRRDAPGANECAHDDFVGPAGQPGIDLSYWRAVGCVRGFQHGEIADVVVDQAVRDGSMTILIELRGVDDPRNDDSVRAQIFASTDPPPVGADGSVLPFGTLSAHGDAATAARSAAARSSTGAHRRTDGRPRAPQHPDRRRRPDVPRRPPASRAAARRHGGGALYGFQPVEELYDIFGRKAGMAGAFALGYTCSGLYAALTSQADGGYDATTGRCTSLSVGYRFDAVPRSSPDEAGMQAGATASVRSRGGRGLTQRLLRHACARCWRSPRDVAGTATARAAAPRRSRPRAHRRRCPPPSPPRSPRAHRPRYRRPHRRRRLRRRRFRPPNPHQPRPPPRRCRAARSPCAGSPRRSTGPASPTCSAPTSWSPGASSPTTGAPVCSPSGRRTSASPAPASSSTRPSPAPSRSRPSPPPVALRWFPVCRRRLHSPTTAAPSSSSARSAAGCCAGPAPTKSARCASASRAMPPPRWATSTAGSRRL
jgi:dienelactone hydrolase